MTKEYDNRNSGVLFKNDRKADSKHPDYTGSYTDSEGREFFLDAWIREGAKGKFMSVRTKEKTARKESGQQGRNVDLSDQLNDDVPFAPEWR